GAAWALNQQGDVARDQGDLAGAKTLYEGALLAFRSAEIAGDKLARWLILAPSLASSKTTWLRTLTSTRASKSFPVSNISEELPAFWKGWPALQWLKESRVGRWL